MLNNIIALPEQIKLILLGIAIMVIITIKLKKELSLLLNNYLVAIIGAGFIIDSTFRSMKEFKILSSEWCQATLILCLFSLIFVYHFDDNDLRLYFLDKSKDDKIKILKTELKHTNKETNTEPTQEIPDPDIEKMFEEFHKNEK